MQAASIANNPALRSQVESQVNLITELSHRTYDSVRKVSELNMQYTRQLIEDSMNLGRELMNCSDPFQMTSTAINQMQPATEHLRTYQRQLMGVLSGVQAEFGRVAEARIPEASRQASAMADEMVRNATAGAHAAGQAGADAMRAGAGAARAAGDTGAAHNPT
jgi:phasin family protein